MECRDHGWTMERRDHGWTRGWTDHDGSLSHEISSCSFSPENRGPVRAMGSARALRWRSYGGLRPTWTPHCAALPCSSELRLGETRCWSPRQRCRRTERPYGLVRGGVLTLGGLQTGLSPRLCQERSGDWAGALGEVQQKKLMAVTSRQAEGPWAWTSEGPRLKYSSQQASLLSPSRLPHRHPQLRAGSARGPGKGLLCSFCCEQWWGL